MAHIFSAVKQELCISRKTHSVEALQRACNRLHELETAGISGMTPESNVLNELYILCCEVAIDLSDWESAESCLKMFVGKRTPTKGLEARSLYCDSALALHNISSLSRGKTRVRTLLRCATKIVTGIKLALEEWPREAHTLTVGVSYLWRGISDLLNRGAYDSVLDIVAFVVILHEKLALGGSFAPLQWSMRYATCLRGVGRHQEAAAQLSALSEMVARVGSERLQLQFFRFQMGFVNAAINRPKQDYTRPVLQAIYAVQAFFFGIADEVVSKSELIAAHDRLISDPEKKEVKPRGRKAAEAEMTFSSVALVKDVLGEVLFALALCGADDVCKESLPKVLTSGSAWSRVFGEYAQAIINARASGALAASKALDASYLTKRVADALFDCIKMVEGTMESARMIDDFSDRSYTLVIGCIIVWNFCLPLLQPETRGRLRHTLKRIEFFLSRYAPSLRRLLIRVVYESSLVEFEEDNLNATMEQLDKALSVDYFVVKADDTITYPMDFALHWLKRRSTLRKISNRNTLSCKDDEVIHLIEQARTTASALDRIALLQSAASKLSPLNRVLDPTTMVKEKTSGQRSERMRNERRQRHLSHQPVPEQLKEQIPRTITDPSVANIYYLLLKVAQEVKNPLVNPIIVTVAESLTCIEVLNESESRDLLLMKAEAHLNLAEVLTIKEKSYDNDSVSNSTASAMKHITLAAQIGVKLCAAGYSEEWLVVNACLSLINCHTESFRRGFFLPAAPALGDLCTALNQAHIDPIKEHKLFEEIGFAYVMSILQTYIASKGEVSGELSCDSLAETLKKTYLYPVCEANNPTLRQALEVCREVMNKWVFPFYKKNFCLIEPCINRLLERGQEGSHHPQEQLLFLLGRLNGSITVGEKRNILNKECLDLLRADPSVELCGRLTMHSMQIPENERVTLELCCIADRLYRDGKLGWGTKTPIVHLGKDKGPSSTLSSAAAAAATAIAGAGAGGGSGGDGPGTVSHPKPTEMDWYWYAELLLFQATALMRLGKNVEQIKRLDLDKRVLLAITNSAIAASHGPTESQVSQITNAYRTFCDISNYFSGSLRELLLPSLRILLSSSMLSKLKSSIQVNGNNAHRGHENIYTLLTMIVEIFLASLSEKGAYEEGIKAINSFLTVLPPKHHKSLRAFEAQFRCNLGLPIEELLSKVKGGDPETEAAVWISIAKNAATHAESVKRWMQSIRVLTGKPRERADALLQMAEWMTSRNAISRHQLTTLLLSSLDSLEGFDKLHLRGALMGDSQEATGRSATQMLQSTLAGRTFMLFGSNSSQPGKVVRSGSLVLPSLRDFMTAIRILYFLFLLSTEGCGNEASCFVSKRSCVFTILQYVFCMWQNVLFRLQIQKTKEDAGDVPKTEALQFPETMHGWMGFHVDLNHVDVIRTLCTEDAAYNTEGLWGMLMDVCDFLVEEHMELYVFMIFSWIDFSSKWRYGNFDPLALAVVRSVHLKCFSAAARCGFGSMSNIYNVETPTAEYLCSIQQVLYSEVVLSPPPPTAHVLHFTAFIGSTHRCVLAEAEEVFEMGRVQESLEWSRRVMQCASRIGDRIAVVRCRLLEARAGILKGDGASVAKELVKLEEEYGGLTTKVWTELQLTRFDALLSCWEIEEAISLARKAQQTLSLDVSETVTDDSVAKAVARDVSINSRRRLLRECARRLVSFFGLPPHQFCWPENGEESARCYLSEVCDRLHEYGDWASRLIALRVKQALRPFVDEVVLLGSEASIGKDLLLLLYTEYCECLDVTELVRHEMNLMIPLSSYTQNVPIYPSLLRAFDEVVSMRGRNCLERELLKDFMLLRYQQLTMEQLGIPTGGAKELEPYVVQYMREPALYEYRMKASMHSREEPILGSWNVEFDHIEETESAFAHFRIPMLHMEGACSANAEAMLCRSAENGEECTVARIRARVNAFLAEFHRRLKIFIYLEDPSSGHNILSIPATAAGEEMEEVRSRENILLMRKWSMVPILVPELNSVNKAKRRQTLGSEHRKGKKQAPVEVVVEQPPKNLWLEEYSNLTTVIPNVIDEAHHLFEYKQLVKCYICLAHTLTMSDMPCAAGTAVEFAQAAEMYSFVDAIHCALPGSSPEGVLIRMIDQMKLNAPFFLNTTAFSVLRSAIMDISTTRKLFDPVGNWPDDANTPKPFPSDICTFSVVREGCTSYFLVALRRPDGHVYSRRIHLLVDSLLECESQLEVLKKKKGNEIIKVSISAESEHANMTSVSLSECIFKHLEDVTSPLWADFKDLLAWLAPTCTMFLCLDSFLQPFPLEQLPVFKQFLTVHRELSVLSVRQKISLRVGKATSGGTLFVVDPFGDHEASLQVLFGVECRPKASSSDVIACVRDTYGTLCRPSPLYICRALTRRNYNALLVNMCGSLSSIADPHLLTGLTLDHIQVALLVMGVNDRSLRREQTEGLSQTPLNLFYKKNQVMSLLLLARGVQFLVRNDMPLTPNEADTMSKRCLPFVVGGGGSKGLYEAVCGGIGVGADSCASSFIFYGIPLDGKSR